MRTVIDFLKDETSYEELSFVSILHRYFPLTLHRESVGFGFCHRTEHLSAKKPIEPTLVTCRVRAYLAKFHRRFSRKRGLVSKILHSTYSTYFYTSNCPRVLSAHPVYTSVHLVHISLELKQYEENC